MSSMRMTLAQLRPELREQAERKLAEQAPRIIQQRPCAICEKPFTPKRVGGRHKGVYCSFECMNLVGTVAVSCRHCTTQFRAPAKRERTFCSVTCARAARAAKPSGAWRPCSICGEPFQAPPSSKRATCSAKCARAWRHRRATGESNPNWRDATVDRRCDACGSVFKTRRAGRALYCSRACFHIGEFADRRASRWSTKWGSTAKKAGKRPDLGGQFFRSAWEANYARYLNWLKARGQVKDWAYESETFKFNEVERGVRFYTPDFKVIFANDAVERHEVKGWRHPKGETALKRIAKYYPEVVVRVIDQRAYRAIARDAAKLIPGWES